MAEMYLIATLEKMGANGKMKELKESEREYYSGSGMWTKNPLSARMHKPEKMKAATERAAKPDMRPGYVCGLVAGETRFVATYVVTPEAILEMEKKREEALKEQKKQQALSKLTAEEKALLGIA